MPTPFEINPTLCFALLGTFTIYQWTRPGRSALWAVLVLALVLRAACIWEMRGLGAYYGVRWISYGAFLGIASLIVLAVQMVRSREPERKFLRQTFYAASVFPLCGLLIGYTIPLTIWLRPKTYDGLLLAFDGGLGFQPSFVLGKLLLRHATAWGLTTVIYYAMPFAISILYAAYRRQTHRPVAFLQLFFSLMVLGSFQYGIFPAVGPRYAFQQSYPANPPNLAQIAIKPMSVPDAPRNCVPSLHLAAALAVWWNSRIWPRWGRSLVFLFLVATAFSTLALGEHYLADLVVAFPFTLLFQAAWTRSAQCARRNAIAWGAGLTVAWLVVLHYCLFIFLLTPVISWGLILLTGTASVWLEENLSIAVKRTGDIRGPKGITELEGTIVME